MNRLQWLCLICFGLLMFLRCEQSFAQAMVPINVDAPCFSVSATSTASAAAALPTSGANQVRLVSDQTSTGTIFAAVGAAGVVATVASGTANRTSNPIGPGLDSTFTRDPNGGLFVSAITNTGKTGTLYVCVGNGN